MGRRARADEEKLAKVLAFRLTERDFLAYREKFLMSRMSQSEFFREHVLNNTTRVLARPTPSADSRRAVFLLSKASNNINQLAHRANTENLAGKLSERTFAAFLHQLDRLNEFLVAEAGKTKA